MRKRVSLILLILLFASPSFASAQGGIVLENLHIQLLPEYDRASMLVIYDFDLAGVSTVPDAFTFRIPAEANLFAVAFRDETGKLFDAPHSAPVVEGDWQTISITTNGETVFRIEYYELMSVTDITRIYTFLWPGDFAVNQFSLFLAEPLDVTKLTTDPQLERTQRNDGLPGYGKDFGKMEAGSQFILQLQYDKTSDALIEPPQELQPASPLDENTTGRISINNYLPYIIGALGIALIVGGGMYYWQAGRRRTVRPRRRRHARLEQEGGELYCHQCGTRAKPGDRFCRVCGSRLRQEE